MTIEAVLAVRRKQCVGMADNMLSELKKVQAKSDVLSKMRRHREAIETSDLACFNDDKAFRFVLNLTVSTFVSLDMLIRGDVVHLHRRSI